MSSNNPFEEVRQHIELIFCNFILRNPVYIKMKATLSECDLERENVSIKLRLIQSFLEPVQEMYVRGCQSSIYSADFFMEAAIDVS